MRIGSLVSTLAILVAVILAACAPVEETRPHIVELGGLPGWQQDNPGAALPALIASCRVIETLSADGALGIAGSPTEWRDGCDAVGTLQIAPPAGLDAATRQVLETHFVAIDPGAGTPALVTGYYVPELDGSRIRDAAHPYPLYKLPADPARFDRAEIDGGALNGQGLELVWVSDKLDAFFLQVQGSGIVRLTDGGTMNVGFAGTNDRKYVSIGKAMVDAGIMTKEEASLRTIRAYLELHPDEIDSWLHRNPRYIFFQEAAQQAGGPKGALGVPLTPLRSVAADPAYIPLGVPLWLDTTRPISGDPLRALVVAQDKGAAIKGTGRLDLFWGAGADAETMAGEMKQPGTYWIIVPRTAGERWLAAQGS